MKDFCSDFGRRGKTGDTLEVKTAPIREGNNNKIRCIVKNQNVTYLTNEISLQSYICIINIIQ